MSRSLILVVDDDNDGRRSLVDAIAEADHEVAEADSAEQALKLFKERVFDTVVSDIRLPRASGIELLAWLREINPHVPVILVTAYGSIETAVTALKGGAYDYMLKPLNLEDIQAKVARALEKRRLGREVALLRASLQGRSQGGALIAESPAMRRMLEQASKVASTDATVMLLGESGTGKELVAQLLHAEGRRADAPFVAVNCGAFSETLLESELFGHEKGAFTGAMSRHEGAFERAHEGTLFLDEIGLAPRAVQARLLRALEQREIMRVGGSAPVALDVRVISATNRCLDTMAAEGLFLPDLLYRLRVVTVTVPPLRERIEDIRPLARHFIAWAAETHGRRVDSAEPAFFETLERHAWPGNVRELRHVVESAVILAGAGILKESDITIPGMPVSRAAGREPVFPPGMTLEELELLAIKQALERHAGNATAAADELGVSTKTIQRRRKAQNSQQ